MTLQTIAHLANVSVSTVSRALNNSFDIAPQTRLLVLAAAEECGYFAEKKRIKTENRRKGLLQAAILCPEIESPYYAAMVAELAGLLRRCGSESVIYTYQFDKNNFETIFHQSLNHARNDVIFCLCPVYEAVETSIPVITFGGSDRYTRICCYKEQDIDAIVAHLCSFERPAFLFEEKTEDKARCFARCMAKRGKTFLSYRSSFRFEKAGADGAEHFLALPERPDVILCAYDEVAYGLGGRLLQEGLRIPEDMAIAGLNGLSSSAYCFGGLTTVEYDFASTFAQVIADLTADNVELKKEYLVPSALKIRHSTKRRSGHENTALPR